MVEPIEKLTPEERVNMAYREINEFESQLHDLGRRDNKILGEC